MRTTYHTDAPFGPHFGQRVRFGQTMAKSVGLYGTSAPSDVLTSRAFCLLEPDILEAVNLMPDNQMAIHTTDGCTTNAQIVQTGELGSMDCASNSGCTVKELKPNSFGAGFAQADLIWSDPLSQVAVARLNGGDPWRLYLAGALLVSGSGVPAGCFNWARV